MTTAAHVRDLRGFETQTIALERDAKGNWTVNGTVVKTLKGCTDVDLGCSPSTKTTRLPIRRLRLAVGGSSTIKAAWVRFPGLDVVKAAQTYTRLDEFTYRYKSGAFEAELTVDDDGLVAAYAEWRRTGVALGPGDSEPLRQHPVVHHSSRRPPGAPRHREGGMDDRASDTQGTLRSITSSGSSREDDENDDHRGATRPSVCPRRGRRGHRRTRRPRLADRSSRRSTGCSGRTTSWSRTRGSSRSSACPSLSSSGSSSSTRTHRPTSRGRCSTASPATSRRSSGGACRSRS